MDCIVFHVSCLSEMLLFQGERGYAGEKGEVVRNLRFLIDVLQSSTYDPSEP